MKNKTKSIIILVIIALGILFVFFMCDWDYKTRMAQNWDNIKEDFKIINELAIDYFENNNDNKILDFELKKLITNDDQKEIFDRASKNYSQYNDYGGGITIINYYNGIIEYYYGEGNGYLERIIYSKHSKRELKKIYNKGERHYIIEDLGDNWYYLDEHHL